MIAPFSNRAMRKTAFLLDFVEGNTPIGAYPLEIFQNHRKILSYSILNVPDGSYLHRMLNKSFILDIVGKIFYNVVTTLIGYIPHFQDVLDLGLIWFLL